MGDIGDIGDMGGIASNAFGEHYLFGINRNLFKDTDASTVFRHSFGKSLFEEDSFYLIAGTDSGLLYQYVKAQGVPEGSRYLFVELPQVLALLHGMDSPPADLAVTTGDDWFPHAVDMKIRDYALLGRLYLLRSLGVVHGHCVDYPPLWRKIKETFDGFMQNINMAIQIRPFVRCQIENLSENQVPATCLKETFRGKTAVVLAGGPSLDGLLPWVREHRRDLLVIAASRISRSLLQAGIQPDISVSVDPQNFNLYVCKEMLEFQEGTLLANNYHLSPNLLATWAGPKVFIGPRYPWETPLQPECLPVCGGTTVTNTALDLAVQTGATQVVLGGVDFCFAQQGHTHASGTTEHAMGSMPQRCELQVETNSGMMADSASGYVKSGEHIDVQAYLAGEQGCRVINPAPGAMRLPHVEHITLDAIEIAPLEQPARDILARCVPAFDVRARIKLFTEELGEVDRVLDELWQIKALASDGLRYNARVLPHKARSTGATHKTKQVDPASATKINRIEHQLIAKHGPMSEFIKQYGMSRFIPILGLDLKTMDERVENNQVYFQAMLDTANELVDFLHLARARILSRLEEEKAEPDLARLIEQWHQDQQPGRAIRWAQQHQSHVTQLPAAQQDALRALQDSFEESVEALGQIYISQLERESQLDRIASRAKEYFRCRDGGGLLRLLANLETHRDQQQAAQFVPLVEGYVAEMRNEPERAIDAYRSVVDRLARVDALMRLFELHTRKQDWPNTLAVLEELSGISNTFQPLYADMLQASGDIETAVNIYTDYILGNPDDLNAVMKLGKLFQQSEMADGVEWTMSYILGKDPGNRAARQILNEMRLGHL